MNRNALIQRIHVLKRDLSLGDETYRTILRSISGEESCAVIDDEYLNLIKQQLESLQQKQQHGAPGQNKNTRENAKIAKLGFMLGWSWHDIAGFVKRETQGRKISTRSCDKYELQKIINGMIALINDGLTKGTLKLAHPDLQAFLKYTQQQHK